MHRLKTISASIGVFGLVFLAAPAGAVESTETSESDSTTIRREQNQQNSEVRDKRGEERATKVKALREEATEKAKDRRATMKQSVCEKRQERLQQLMVRMEDRAVAMKDRLDTVYERLTGFYDKGQLTVNDYEAKLSAIETVRRQSAASVNLLSSSGFDIDCTSNGIGQQLDEYRLMVKGVRQNLKEYRKTLVDLVSSMRAAAAEGNNEGNKTEPSTRTDQTTPQETSNE